MNVLRNYTLKVSGFSFSDMTKILNESHSRYYYTRKGLNLYIISDKNTNKIHNLKCISKIYTNKEDGTLVKIPKNNGECFNCKRMFSIPTEYNCIECHSYMLNQFRTNNAKIVKK